MQEGGTVVEAICESGGHLRIDAHVDSHMRTPAEAGETVPSMPLAQWYNTWLEMASENAQMFSSATNCRRLMLVLEAKAR